MSNEIGDKNNFREEKLKKLQRYCKWFEYIPFVDFALAAGSLAFGNVHEHSDFDVIVSARTGRIFTARFISMLVFNPLDVLGITKKRLHHTASASDKICLNHFITETRYCLMPPYNAYWEQLYAHLIPMYGSQKHIEQFFFANASWVGRKPEWNEVWWVGDRKKIVRRIIEFFLRDFVGNVIEQIVKWLQIWRIERSEQKRNKQNNSHGRVRWSDDELEFHPDTSRIEEIIEHL